MKEKIYLAKKKKKKKKEKSLARILTRFCILDDTRIHMDFAAVA